MISVHINFVLICWRVWNSHTLSISIVLLVPLSIENHLPRVFCLLQPLWFYTVSCNSNLLGVDLQGFLWPCRNPALKTKETQPYLEICLVYERHYTQKGMKTNSPCGIWLSQSQNLDNNKRKNRVIKTLNKPRDNTWPIRSNWLNL